MATNTIPSLEESPMPSKVMDKKLLQMPEGNVVESDKEWARCGKWMLHHPQADLGSLDSAWTALKPLLDDGTLIMMKATTGLTAKDGVSLHCFTRPGIEEARRAATAISMLIDFRGLMYYKLNEHKSQRAANQYGDSRLAKYMYTFRRHFLSKQNGRWVKENEDATENTVPISSQFLNTNFSGIGVQLSTCMEQCFWNVPKDHQYDHNKTSNWYTFCSCEDDGLYLSEADRVWRVANQLLEEGLFVGLFLKKLKDSKYAEMHFYVSEYCDVYSRLTACDRIFKEASFRSVMYFKETATRILNTKKKNNTLQYEYKYTSDGELYMRTDYAEEYIFM